MDKDKIKKLVGLIILIINGFNVYYFGDDPYQHKQLFSLYLGSAMLFFCIWYINVYDKTCCKVYFKNLGKR